MPKDKELIYKGACVFKIWRLSSGKLRVQADLEDLKGLEIPKKKKRPTSG